jgi:hypothetical protein
VLPFTIRTHRSAACLQSRPYSPSDRCRLSLEPGPLALLRRRHSFAGRLKERMHAFRLVAELAACMPSGSWLNSQWYSCLAFRDPARSYPMQDIRRWIRLPGGMQAVLGSGEPNGLASLLRRLSDAADTIAQAVVSLSPVEDCCSTLIRSRRTPSPSLIYTSTNGFTLTD